MATSRAAPFMAPSAIIHNHNNQCQSMLSSLLMSTLLLLLLLLTPPPISAHPKAIDLLDQSMEPVQTNYCNDSSLLAGAGLLKSPLGQFLGYECSGEFYHCRWQSDGYRTYKKTCRVGLVYDTLGTQNCNYDYNVKGCAMMKGAASCNTTQFACAMSESCVEMAQRCDGHYDCAMEEDEQNCPMCAAGEFACVVSEECIPMSRRCNGITECTDGSDETNCEDGCNLVCGTGKFLCGKSGECIGGERRCDGERDCPHGEDEMLCRVKPVERRFTCESRDAYVAMHQVCDGVPNCPDASDELYCDVHQGPGQPPIAPPGVPPMSSFTIPPFSDELAPPPDYDEDEAQAEANKTAGPPKFPLIVVNFPTTETETSSAAPPPPAATTTVPPSPPPAAPVAVQTTVQSTAQPVLPVTSYTTMTGTTLGLPPATTYPFQPPSSPTPFPSSPRLPSPQQALSTLQTLAPQLLSTLTEALLPAPPPFPFPAPSASPSTPPHVQGGQQQPQQRPPVVYERPHTNTFSKPKPRINSPPDSGYQKPFVDDRVVGGASSFTAPRSTVIVPPTAHPVTASGDVVINDLPIPLLPFTAAPIIQPAYGLVSGGNKLPPSTALPRSNDQQIAAAPPPASARSRSELSHTHRPNHYPTIIDESAEVVERKEPKAEQAAENMPRTQMVRSLREEPPPRAARQPPLQTRQAGRGRSGATELHRADTKRPPPQHHPLRVSRPARPLLITVAQHDEGQRRPQKNTLTDTKTTSPPTSTSPPRLPPSLPPRTTMNFVNPDLLKKIGAKLEDIKASQVVSSKFRDVLTRIEKVLREELPAHRKALKLAADSKRIKENDAGRSARSFAVNATTAAQKKRPKKPTTSQEESMTSSSTSHTPSPSTTTPLSSSPSSSPSPSSTRSPGIKFTFRSSSQTSSSPEQGSKPPPRHRKRVRIATEPPNEKRSKEADIKRSKDADAKKLKFAFTSSTEKPASRRLKMTEQRGRKLRVTTTTEEEIKSS